MTLWQSTLDLRRTLVLNAGMRRSLNNESSLITVELAMHQSPKR